MDGKNRVNKYMNKLWITQQNEDWQAIGKLVI